MITLLIGLAVEVFAGAAALHMARRKGAKSCRLGYRRLPSPRVVASPTLSSGETRGSSWSPRAAVQRLWRSRIRSRDVMPSLRAASAPNRCSAVVRNSDRGRRNCRHSRSDHFEHLVGVADWHAYWPPAPLR